MYFYYFIFLVEIIISNKNIKLPFEYLNNLLKPYIWFKGPIEIFESFIINLIFFNF